MAPVIVDIDVWDKSDWSHLRVMYDDVAPVHGKCPKLHLVGNALLGLSRLPWLEPRQQPSTHRYSGSGRLMA